MTKKIHKFTNTQTDENRDTKFYDWLVLWLELRRYSLKPSTFERYERLVAKFSDADFFLSAVSVEYLQSKINELYIKGQSYSSMRQCLVCVRMAIRKAVILGYLPQVYLSYCDLVDIPRRKPKEIVSLSPFEVRRIIHFCYTVDNCGSLFLFLLYSGVRVGEALAIRWSDVDFNSRTISIMHTLYRGVLLDTKTEKGSRVIPLTNELARLIRTQEHRSEFIFCRDNGELWSYRSVLYYWHKLLDSLGYKRCGLHVLRHTYATQALRCGVNAVVLARLLGHSDSSFTLRRYCDANYDDMRDAVRRIKY